MLTFQQSNKDIAKIYLEDTDRPLPEVLNPNTRYRMLATIAKGGKSIIQSCLDMHLGRVVIYKSLRPELKGDEIEERRLLREARVSAILQHPNTIPVYEIGRDRQHNCYFTMKFVHGYTLREILDYRDRYDLSQLTEVLEQVAHAVANAHLHGVVHRDIKPENILVGPFGEVLLLDWGFAKVWHKDPVDMNQKQNEKKEENQKAQSHAPSKTTTDKSMTGYQKLQGTLSYMSPEQMHKLDDITFASDVYSLGVILYEILAGQLPFAAEQTFEVIDAVKNTEAEPPSSVSKYPVPKSLEQLTQVCLRKSGKHRPDIHHFIRTLQQDWSHDQMLGG